MALWAVLFSPFLGTPVGSSVLVEAKRVMGILSPLASLLTNTGILATTGEAQLTAVLSVAVVTTGTLWPDSVLIS